MPANHAGTPHTLVIVRLVVYDHRAGHVSRAWGRGAPGQESNPRVVGVTGETAQRQRGDESTMSGKVTMTEGTSRAPYNGPTYYVAPPDYACKACGFRHPVGRTNNMGQTEGSATMLRHLRDEHDYKPLHPIKDWQPHIPPRTAA
jgi:hypothetical protein